MARQTTIKRDEMRWRTALEELFGALRSRELCDDRPARILLDRDWFECALKELCACHAGFSFNTDRFELWGIPVELDWKLAKDSAVLESV